MHISHQIVFRKDIHYIQLYLTVLFSPEMEIQMHFIFNDHSLLCCQIFSLNRLFNLYLSSIIHCRSSSVISSLLHITEHRTALLININHVYALLYFYVCSIMTGQILRPYKNIHYYQTFSRALALMLLSIGKHCHSSNSVCLL